MNPFRTRVALVLVSLATFSCGDEKGKSAEPDGGPGRRDAGGSRDVSFDVSFGDVPTADVVRGPTECLPDQQRCAGGRARQRCAADGTTWEALAACSSSEVCAGAGVCQNPCAVPGKYAGSTVSCEFWSVDLGQWHVGPGHFSLDPSVSVVPHAVLIGNPGDRPATVTFDVADGTTIAVPDPVVPPGEARSFLMPVLSQQDTGVTSQAIRISASAPVIASQFNTASNAPGFARHSTDASLLLPIELLGREHFVVTQWGVEGFLGGPPSHGYFTVVAVSPGTTHVSLLLTADTVAGGGIPALRAGSHLPVVLEQGQVLTLNAVPRPVSVQGGAGGDLTGSQVLSSQPVAVFGGHQCMVVLGGNCDHLESQLLPVERWGTRYVAAPFVTPNRLSLYRVIAATDGTVVRTTPAVSGLDGVTLERGGWVEASTDATFQIEGSHPIAVTQFMGGNDGESDPYLVDTSMTVLIPVDQYRDAYPLLVPEGFARNHLVLIRQEGEVITRNGAPISATFRSLPGTGMEVGDVRVDEGVQRLESDRPFGVVSYGYDHKVSYVTPGGMGAP